MQESEQEAGRIVSASFFGGEFASSIRTCDVFVLCNNFRNSRVSNW